MDLLIASTHTVHWSVTTVFSLLLGGLILCLAFEEKIHAKKSIIAGSFAAICLLLGTFTGILSFEKVVVGSHRAELPANQEVDVLVYSEADPDSSKLIEVAGKASNPEEATTATEAEADHEGDDHSDQHTLHVDGHRISTPVYIPGVDWSVIAIILGSSLFVDVTSKSGLFTWIAVKVTKASGGDPRRLLFFYGVMTVIFSAVLNNVTAMIIVGSLTAVSLDKLKQNKMLLGFLLIEGLLTNIGGLLTLISSVPNIIVGTAANISFLTFFIKSAPFVIVATALTLWMGSKLFGIHKLKNESEKAEAKSLVAGFDENDGVQSWGFFRFSVAMLLLFIVTIATTSALPGISKLGMGFVAMTFAIVMLWRFKSEVNRFYSAVDWDLLGFFVALFMVIYVMEHAMVLERIGDGLQIVMSDISAKTPSALDASVLLIGSAVVSSVTDNIPLAAMFASILGNLGAPESSTLWWSVIFGANLGGNITPIGSASTLVAVTIMHKHKLPLSFAAFVKAAIPYAIVQIVLALFYVVLILPMLDFG